MLIFRLITYILLFRLQLVLRIVTACSACKNVSVKTGVLVRQLMGSVFALPVSLKSTVRVHVAPAITAMNAQRNACA